MKTRCVSPLIVTKVFAVVAAMALVFVAYIVWARTHQLNWGATAEEIHRPMPGDKLNPSPTFLATRAITIAGTPKQIWPWLVQMGYGRAGFYGYDILENLGSSRGIHSADRIMPELQEFKVGDPVPISAVAGAVLYAIEPEKYLIWGGASPEFPGGFTWALYPVDGTSTRLVSRIRWSHHWTRPGILALETLTEFSDYLAIRKILFGIKDRVEGRRESFARNTTEFAAYLANLFLFFPVVLTVLLVRRLTWRRWLTASGTGISWLTAWYAPIQPWMSAVLGCVTAIVVYLQFRSPRHRRK